MPNPTISATTNAQSPAPLLPAKVQVIRSHVTRAPYQQFLDSIIQLAVRRQSSYVCFANVHMLMEADQQSDFREVVNEADLVAPDGRPVSLLMNYRYGIQQDRVCGMDLFPDLLRAAEAASLSVFFYGSTEEVLHAIEEKAQREFPQLKIAGTYSPPFRPLTPEEDQAATDMINQSGAHLVFVSLGCPKQERWMHQHRPQVQACMLGLGQAFLTYTGYEKRLPAWARNFSLEWVYRLYLEPRRLWKRYLVGNSRFLWRAVQSLVRS